MITVNSKRTSSTAFASSAPSGSRDAHDKMSENYKLFQKRQKVESVVFRRTIEDLERTFSFDIDCPNQSDCNECPNGACQRAKLPSLTSASTCSSPANKKPTSLQNICAARLKSPAADSGENVTLSPSSFTLSNRASSSSKNYKYSTSQQKVYSLSSLADNTPNGQAHRAGAVKESSDGMLPIYSKLISMVNGSSSRSQPRKAVTFQSQLQNQRQNQRQNQSPTRQQLQLQCSTGSHQRACRSLLQRTLSKKSIRYFIYLNDLNTKRQIDDNNEDILSTYVVKSAGAAQGGDIYDINCFKTNINKILADLNS